MKTRPWSSLALFLIVVTAIPAMADTQQRYMSVAPHGRYVALFEVTPTPAGGAGNLVGYMRRDDAWTNAPFTLQTGAVPQSLYDSISQTSFQRMYSFGTPTQGSNPFGGGPVPPVVANVAPAAAAGSDTDHLYVAFAKNGGTQQSPYTLALGYVAKNDRTTEFDLQCGPYGQNPCTVENGAPNVGISVSPDGAILVAYANAAGQIEIDAWWVTGEAQASLSGTALAKIAPPAGASGWNGNVTITSAALPTKPKDPPANAIYLALRAGNTMYFGTANVPQLDPNAMPQPSFQWRSIQPDGGISQAAGSIVNVTIGSDTRLYLAYLDAQSAARLEQLLPSGDVVPKGAISGSAKVLTTPVFAYTIGAAVSTAKWPIGDSTTQVKVPVYQSVFYQADSDDPRVNPGGTVVNYGAALKDPLQQFNSAKDVLIGIIEGPPPIPKENVKSSGPVNTSVELGHTTYGDSQTNSSDSKTKMGGGVIIKEEAKSEGFSLDMNSKFGFSNTSSNSTDATISSAYTSSGEAKKENGEWEVEPYGTAFLMSTQVAGYRYYFLDQFGNQVPGGPARTDMWLTAPTMTAKTFQFSEPTPADAIQVIPGELLSYGRTQAGLAALAKSAIALNNPRSAENDIVFSWSMSGTYSEEAETAQTTTTSSDTTVDIEALLGTSVDFPGIAEWKQQVGGSFNYEQEDTQSTTNRQKYSTEVGGTALVPQLNDPGTYTDYVYRTYFLKGDEQYAADLLNYLRNHPSMLNTALLARLVDPGNPNAKAMGAPWKITYGILSDAGAYGYTRVPGGMKAIPPSLQARGITNAGDIGELHAAFRRLSEPALRLGPVRQPNPQAMKAEAIARQLTPREKNDLMAYVKAGHDEAMADFMRRHPQWHPSPVHVSKAKAPAPKLTWPPRRATYAHLAENAHLWQAKIAKQNLKPTVTPLGSR